MTTKLLFAVFSLIIVSVLVVAVTDTDSFTISQKIKTDVKKRYGKFAVNRINALLKMMNKHRNSDEYEKVKAVNRFFNMVPYKSDMKVWGQKDYWATRIEFLGKDRGDCEDYALAKYFTLKQMGVSTKKMYLTYAKSLRYKVAHMVLTYFKTPGSIPLVLGNYNKKILLATQRKDLVPIYSFNGDKLFISKQTGLGQYVPSGMKRNKKWNKFIIKARREEL